MVGCCWRRSLLHQALVPPPTLVTRTGTGATQLSHFGEDYLDLESAEEAIFLMYGLIPARRLSGPKVGKFIEGKDGSQEGPR